MAKACLNRVDWACAPWDFFFRSLFLNQCEHIKSRVKDGIRFDHRAGEASCFNREKAQIAEKSESIGVPLFKCRRGEGRIKDSTRTVTVISNCRCSYARCLSVEKEKRDLDYLWVLLYFFSSPASPSSLQFCLWVSRAHPLTWNQMLAS